MELEENDDAEESPFLPPEPPDPRKRLFLRPNPLLLIYLIVFFVGIGGALLDSPFVRLLEAKCCSMYYGDVGKPIPEHKCKVDEVQSHVAYVRGWQTFFDNLPSLILTIPMGIFADRYGRRKVLIVNATCGCFHLLWVMFVNYMSPAVPIEFVWFSAITNLFGGGRRVSATTAFVIVTDLTTKSERTTHFLRLGATVLGCSLIFSPISAALMQISVWVPLWIGFACIAAGTSLTWVLPETLNYKRDDGSLNHQQQQEPIGNEGFYEELKATIHTSYSGLKLLVTDRRIAALLFCFFVHSIMTDADAFFIQYISKKFDFTIAATTYLLSIRFGLVLVMLALVLPKTGDMLTSRLHFSSFAKDLWVSRTSAFCSMLAYLTIASAPSIALAVIGMVLDCIGAGFMLSLQGLLSATAPEELMAGALSLGTMQGIIGTVIGAPMMAAAFGIGLKAGGVWVGTPFFISAGMGVVMLMALVAVIRERQPPAIGEQELNSDDQGQIRLD